MALTDAERAKVLLHLGFSGTAGYTTASGPVLATYSVQTVAEAQMGRLTAHGEARVRQILATMDGIETRMTRAQSRLAVNRLGDIEVRQSELSELEGEIRRWGYRLAETLGCYPNQHSERYRGGGICAARVG